MSLLSMVLYHINIMVEDVFRSCWQSWEQGALNVGSFRPGSLFGFVITQIRSDYDPLIIWIGVMTRNHMDHDVQCQMFNLSVSLPPLPFFPSLVTVYTFIMAPQKAKCSGCSQEFLLHGMPNHQQKCFPIATRHQHDKEFEAN